MGVSVMPKTDTINVRIEPELKKEVEETLNELGMNIAEAITIYFKQIILTESIPFEIKKPKLNKETIKAIEDVQKGENLSKGYTNLEQMWKDLDNEE